MVVFILGTGGEASDGGKKGGEFSAGELKGPSGVKQLEFRKWTVDFRLGGLLPCQW